jgi:hypothetical protein
MRPTEMPKVRGSVFGSFASTIAVPMPSSRATGVRVQLPPRYWSVRPPTLTVAVAGPHHVLARKPW